MLSESILTKIKYYDAGLSGPSYNLDDPTEGRSIIKHGEGRFIVLKSSLEKKYKLDKYEKVKNVAEKPKTIKSSGIKIGGSSYNFTFMPPSSVTSSDTTVTASSLSQTLYNTYIDPPDDISLGKKTFLDSVKPKEGNGYFKLCTTYEQIIIAMCFAKITGYVDSAALFGYKPTKLKMCESKQLFNIVGIHEGFLCKKDGQNRDIIELLDDETGKRMKFLLSDVEIIFPDIKQLTKGYNLPKSRVIKKGVTAIVKDDRKTGFKKNDKVKVVDTTTVGAKKYAVIETANGIKRIPSCKLKVF